MSEAQVVDVPTVEPEILARHLAWERSMQVAVARELAEHRGQGHTVVSMCNGRIVSLAPGQY